MRNSPSRTIALLVALASTGCSAVEPPLEVRFTWLSNTTWLIEADGIQIFADAAISRWDFARPDFKSPESFMVAPVVSDAMLVEDVLSAVEIHRGPSYIVVGHGHTDHAIDLAAFADHSAAQVIGGRSVCLLAEAQGIPPRRCRAVEGGEVVELSPRLEVRVIRWTHSGNPSDRLGRFIQAPKELRQPPPVDSQTGGIGAAPWQGYPNGGGARAYLFRYDGPEVPLQWLISDTGNPFTFDSIPQIGPDYLSDVGVDLSHLDFPTHAGTPRAWLESAVEEAAVDSIDVWLGYASPAHVRQVYGLLYARVFVPHHWDPYLSGFRPGIQRPFRGPQLKTYLDSVGATLMPQSQYLERYELKASGLTIVPNDAVQTRLGLTVNRQN